MEEKKVKKVRKAKKDEKIGEALLKVALGYQIAEVTEEYAEVDGALKLTKRKKTKKDVPPDLKAVQLLLSSGESADYGQWSDEALEAEKKKLLLQLQEKMSGGAVMDGGVDGSVAVGTGVDGAEGGAEHSVSEALSIEEKKPTRTVKRAAAKKSVAQKKTGKKTAIKKAAGEMPAVGINEKE